MAVLLYHPPLSGNPQAWLDFATARTGGDPVVVDIRTTERELRQQGIDTGSLAPDPRSLEFPVSTAAQRLRSMSAVVREGHQARRVAALTQRRDVVIPGTGSRPAIFEKDTAELSNLGYQVHLIVVAVPMEWARLEGMHGFFAFEHEHHEIDVGPNEMVAVFPREANREENIAGLRERVEQAHTYPQVDRLTVLDADLNILYDGIREENQVELAHCNGSFATPGEALDFGRELDLSPEERDAWLDKFRETLMWAKDRITPENLPAFQALVGDAYRVLNLKSPSHHSDEYRTFATEVNAAVSATESRHLAITEAICRLKTARRHGARLVESLPDMITQNVKVIRQMIEPVSDRLETESLVHRRSDINSSLDGGSLHLLRIMEGVRSTFELAFNREIRDLEELLE